MLFVFILIKYVINSKELKGVYFFVTSVIKAKNAWYFYKNTAGETVLDPSHLKEYKSIQEFEKVFDSIGFAIVKSSASRTLPCVGSLVEMVSKICRGSS